MDVRADRADGVLISGRIRQFAIGVMAAAMLFASAAMVSMAMPAWTTVDFTTSFGRELHGTATAGLGVVIALMSSLILLGRGGIVACATAGTASLIAVIAAWDDISQAKRVPGDAGDADLRVVIHPALRHTLWAGVIALTLSVAIGIALLVRPRLHTRLASPLAVGVLGACTIAASLIVLLWPLDANGVSGSALRPHYSEFIGYQSYAQLPAHPTTADLRRAGIRLPREFVTDRRHTAEVVATFGAIAVVTAVGMSLTRGRRVDEVSPIAI